nr:MAG TPA: hypothetical protein [Caudoviricetes sp.]
MDSKQIAAAMKHKQPVVYDGRRYLRISAYILWYDSAGARRTSVEILDPNNNSITRAPADRVTLAEKEVTT